VQKVSTSYLAIDYVYVFKTRTAKHKKTSQVSIVFNDEFVHVVQCYKRHHKYCVSRAKSFTSGDIDLNPAPVVTQGNNPNNLIELLQFRLAQHGLIINNIIILRNRAEYRLILSRLGLRARRLKSGDIPQD